MKEVIVGIDLGTTSSSVAAVVDGDVVLIKDADGSFLIPSVVGITAAGKAVVGGAARELYVSEPQRVVKSIKRHMGSGYRVTVGDDDYTPQEISALILKHLKKIAEKHIGLPVKKAVITVPAYFTDMQRLATKEAGMIAGLEVVRMINEPTAAALAYERGEKGSGRILVYDFGGGTFDVSVVAIDDGVIEVMASHGNPYLGGDDFDAKIASKIIDILFDDGLDIADDHTALAQVRQIAEKAKRALSDRPFVHIKDKIDSQSGGSVALDWELCRDEYESMIGPLVDESLQSVHIALRNAGIGMADIDRVVMVGGCTATPLVRRSLQGVCKKRLHTALDPSSSVAIGAAMQAAFIAGDRVSGVLIDIAPYTFGISTLDSDDGDICPYSFMPIIEKSSVLPVEKSEVFYTATDGQRSVEINVYQGDDMDALKNLELGRFMIEGLSDVPAGNPIVVSFRLDLDGLLHVTAMEKSTGLQKTVTIDGKAGGLNEQKLRASITRIKNLDLCCDVGVEQDEKLEDYPVLLAQAVIREAEEEVLVNLSDSEQHGRTVKALNALQEAVAKQLDDDEIFRRVGDLSYLICLFRSKRS